MDLAIDFCEDVPPLHPNQIQKIVNIFTAHGAQAKVSSIHVNGWFGHYNKLQKTLEFLSTEFNCSELEAQKICVFAGDSPNDEPMFEFFDNSVAVANFKKFANQVKHQPKFITDLEGGFGFAELSRHLLKLKES
jgi:3-deoxy-D-manno-octulosonate 8-phosphate phosphatase KdsC-like HAD superfamily phosphatase